MEFYEKLRFERIKNTAAEFNFTVFSYRINVVLDCGNMLRKYLLRAESD